MQSILTQLSISPTNPGAWTGTKGLPSSSAAFESLSPINNFPIATINAATKENYEQIISAAQETFAEWRLVPAPQRGLLVREIAQALRDLKDPLGELVTLETGKILAEGKGEIQEAIDIADFAVGLSRQLYGKTMHSERPEHRMYEQWHPLGLIGVITAFNFPAAVWAWNAMIAAVCGDVLIWKPSEYTPLTALAVQKICGEIAKQHGFPGLFNLIISRGPEAGEWISNDARIPLVSATGSCGMGRLVGTAVAKRLGRSLLELGGNNSVIILKDADLDLALRSTLFGSVGTAGQRCTTTRRLLVEKPIIKNLLDRLTKFYSQVKIGDPRESGVLMGPLINEKAISGYERAIAHIKAQGGEVVYGGEVLQGMPSKLYVKPTIVRARADMQIVQEETFAPILYVIEIDGLEQAIQINNGVAQGLSSALFTKDLQSAEKFLSHAGSDCGIANINIGTSGAEIGGAFGGEKDTGGGREAGSDSWKQYMRRQTNTINFGKTLPLAQGIKFEVP